MSMKRKTQAREFRMRLERLEQFANQQEQINRGNSQQEAEFKKQLEIRMKSFDKELDRMELAWKNTCDSSESQTKMFVKAVGQRNAAYREVEQARKAVKSWRCMTYAAITAAIGVILVAIMSMQTPEAKAADLPDQGDNIPRVEITEVPDANYPETPDGCQEEAENELIEAAILERAHKIENVKVTNYCICQRCCGKAPNHPAYGITASGRRATPGVSVAVDPTATHLRPAVNLSWGRQK